MKVKFNYTWLRVKTKYNALRRVAIPLILSTVIVALVIVPSSPVLAGGSTCTGAVTVPLSNATTGVGGYVDKSTHPDDWYRVYMPSGLLDIRIENDFYSSTDLIFTFWEHCCTSPCWVDSWYAPKGTDGWIYDIPVTEGYYYFGFHHDGDESGSCSFIWRVNHEESNDPPYQPSSPSPSDGATGISIHVNPSWTGGDPNGDSVTYDVYFEKNDSSPDQLVSNDQSGTSYEPGTLDYNSHYYWQIEAKDEHGATRLGPVWDFTTSGEPNQPPYQPTDASPADGATDITIYINPSWNGGDPDGDSVTYDVYFEKDDSTPDQLVSDDQSAISYDPGTLDYNSHYYWQIEAKDEHGATTSGPVWDFTTGDEPNDPPTAYIDSITPDPATQGTHTVSFTGHGTDSDGSVVAYRWVSSMDGQLSTSSSFSKPASELSVGTHTIYFEVQDDDGAWSTLDTESLTIESPGGIGSLEWSLYDNYGDGFSTLAGLIGALLASMAAEEPWVVDVNVHAYVGNGEYVDEIAVRVVDEYNPGGKVLKMFKQDNNHWAVRVKALGMPEGDFWDLIYTAISIKFSLGMLPRMPDCQPVSLEEIVVTDVDGGVHHFTTSESGKTLPLVLPALCDTIEKWKSTAESVSLLPLAYLATVFSPVDISIEDPDGLVMSKLNNEIPDSLYFEKDVDNDGDLEELFFIMELKTGDYKILAEAKPDAEPSDTYTLKVSAHNTTIVLAEDIPISDVPSEGYDIRSTEGGIEQIMPDDTFPFCFIATAAYGTPMAEEVQVLREFRNEYLLTNPLGQSFVNFYYTFSPPIAEFMTEHPGLKPIVRAALAPFVAMSAVVVNTSLTVKVAALGSLALVSVIVAIWVIRRRHGRSDNI